MNFSQCNLFFSFYITKSAIYYSPSRISVGIYLQHFKCGTKRLKGYDFALEPKILSI